MSLSHLVDVEIIGLCIICGVTRRASAGVRHVRHIIMLLDVDSTAIFL
jgi:hypothetical protein